MSETPISAQRAAQSIHPTAIIHDEAELGPGVVVGPYSVLGPGVFVGGGISQPLGRNAALLVSAFYNLTYSSSERVSPYARPWVFRVGIVAGF